jgi:OmpA-OmpF porin, OOP family
VLLFLIFTKITIKLHFSQLTHNKHIMKKPIPLLAGLLALVFLGGQWLYQKNCNCGIVTTAAATATSTPVAAPTLASAITISDGAAFNANFEDNLRFKQSGFSHLTPLSSPLADVFKKTTDYLKGHPDRSLKVTGYYAESEKNNSTFPNIGLARANDIKMLLTSLGASASQIEMADVKTNDLQFRGDTLVGGANYEFMGLVKNDARLEAIEKRLKGNPIVLYFATNQSNLDLSDAQKQDFSDLQYYLEHKAGVKSKITGHTDNVGNLDKNVTLSKSRAEFVRSYMSKVGFPSDKLNTDGKGPNTPISSNETAEGRSKNRRVEVGIE